MEDCLVIGAGMTGLTAARLLETNGLRVCVVDKGRGVGGRLSTRRIGGLSFDHGAQYFTARHPAFAAQCRAWETEGVVQSWFQEDGEPRYVSPGGMSALAKHMASGLRVRLQAKVAAVRPDRDGWRALLEGGDEIAARALLVTAPVEQSLALVSEHVDVVARQALSSIEYAPCFAVMARLDGPSAIPAPGFARPTDGIIAWLSDNARKLSQGEPGAVTIHATADYSRLRFDAPLADVERELLDAAAPWLGARVVERQVHRWRYALVTKRAEQPCLLAVQEPRLVVAGDGFGGPRVEGAWVSGQEAYRLLTDSRPVSY